MSISFIYFIVLKFTRLHYLDKILFYKELNQLSSWLIIIKLELSTIAILVSEGEQLGGGDGDPFLQ